MFARVAVLALLAAPSVAFAPAAARGARAAPLAMRASDAQDAISRADVLRAPLAALVLGGVASQALAEGEAAPAAPVIVEKVTEEPKVYEFPKGRSQDTRRFSRDGQDAHSFSRADWGIDGDYYTDAAKVVRHMRIATSMDKNYPNMEVSRGGRRRQQRRAPLPHTLLLAHADGSPRVRRLSART